MDRAQTIFKHWRHEQDAQGLVWLTFDRQGESANTFSKDDETVRTFVGRPYSLGS